MNNPTAFRTLRALLATNYPTQDDARRVVAEAGLDQAYFQFSDKAVNNWHNILTEAEKRAGLTALLQIVLEEYGMRPDVVRAIEAYGVTSPQPPIPDENRATTIYNVNTGGGPYIAGNVTTGGDFVGRDRITSALQEPHKDLTASYSPMEKRFDLEKELTQHQRNLQLLREQKAVYAKGEEPLRLLNQIDHEKREIERIMQELQN